MRVFLWILLGIAGLAALVLTAPVHLDVRASATLHGGHAQVRIRVLAISMRIGFRFRYLDGPFDGEVFWPNGHTVSFSERGHGKKEHPMWTAALLQLVHVRSAHIEWMVGVAGAPDTTAILAGILGTLTETLAPVTVTPVFTQNALRLNLEGIARVRLADIIKERFLR